MKKRARYAPRKIANAAIPHKADSVPLNSPPSVAPKITNADAESKSAHTSALRVPRRRCAAATGVSITVIACESAYMISTPAKARATEPDKQQKTMTMEHHVSTASLRIRHFERTHGGYTRSRLTNLHSAKAGGHGTAQDESMAREEV